MARVTAGAQQPIAPERAPVRVMAPVHTDDGVPVHVRHWSAGFDAFGTVIVVHGLGEHIGRYDELAGDLNAVHWHVCGFDLRGHGASGGARGRIPREDSLLRDLARVIDEVREVREGPVVLLGHSLGGVLASRFVVEGMHDIGQPPSWYRRVDGLVMSSPALQVKLSVVQRLLLAAGGALAPDMPSHNGIDPAWVSRDPKVVERYRKDPLIHHRVTARLARFVIDSGEIVRRQASVWSLPTLLLWAAVDRCVDADGSVAFATEAPREFVAAQSFEGMAHEIFNDPERERPVRLMQRWLQEQYA
jgi:alpha-beta hydrolase superfamily lysophospholipase